MSLLKEEDLINILPKQGPTVKETIKYLEKYTKDFIVIKMGGSILSNKDLFNNLIQDIVILKKLGLSIFLIHGGGSKISKKLDNLSIKSNFIDGLRVTDNKIIDIVEDVFKTKVTSIFKQDYASSRAVYSDESFVYKVFKQSKVVDQLEMFLKNYNGDLKLLNVFVFKP